MQLAKKMAINGRKTAIWSVAKFGDQSRMFYSTSRIKVLKSYTICFHLLAIMDLFTYKILFLNIFSINAMLFFVDSMTWPEALRQYLSSDPTANAEPLAILKEYQEYPVEKDAKESKAFIDARISLLGFLADQFITTNAVREDIHNEGKHINLYTKYSMENSKYFCI